ncbi:hypothetical protein GCM10027051_16050 [Niabella terrae]
MERFSMKEFRPLSLEEKKLRLKQDIQDLEEERQPYVTEKRELELRMTMLNEKLKVTLPEAEFDAIKSERADIVKQKYNVEEKIRRIGSMMKEKNLEIEKADVYSRRTSKTGIGDALTELRNKYNAFASDATRVSSTRVMASKFVEELNELIQKIGS